VVLNVSNLDRALAYYRILYGKESIHRESFAAFEFPRSNTRLELQEIPYEYGTAPGIATFGIKTRPYDRQAVVNLLSSLGATVMPLRATDTEAGIQFIDPDGITIELNPV
jgi:catechol 2,3-dioxygenase-like lactoylglutathione lyase family enzyme